MRKDAPGPGQGFSSVELLAVLAVSAILLGLALPGFQDTLRRQRVASAMHLLGTQLAQARNTAITRRVPVTVCPSSGGGLCRADPDWSAGWLLYQDPGRGEQQRSPADVLREVRLPAHASIRIVSSSGRVRVRYQPDGRSGGSNLTFRICTGDALDGEIIVNISGRTRTRRVMPGATCERP